jgi:hypothetical protein
MPLSGFNKSFGAAFSKGAFLKPFLTAVKGIKLSLRLYANFLTVAVDFQEFVHLKYSSSGMLQDIFRCSILLCVFKKCQVR